MRLGDNPVGIVVRVLGEQFGIDCFKDLKDSFIETCDNF